jgi:hypothetical protein
MIRLTSSLIFKAESRSIDGFGFVVFLPVGFVGLFIATHLLIGLSDRGVR